MDTHITDSSEKKESKRSKKKKHLEAMKKHLTQAVEAINKKLKK